MTTDQLLECEHPTNRSNYTWITMGEITYVFSYRTCVAFHTYSGWTYRENDWGPTTGKHLVMAGSNDKSARLPADAFLTALTEAKTAEVTGR